MPRPSYKPTPEKQRVARAMAAVGARHEEIAAELEITAKTLRKHFRQEIRQAATRANVQVAQSLYKQATSGRNIAATIYWDKTRGFGRPRSIDTGSQPMLPPQIIIRQAEEQQNAAGGPDR
jgi:hypothetical protein